jgi:hypothetical protein
VLHGVELQSRAHEHASAQNVTPIGNSAIGNRLATTQRPTRILQNLDRNLLMGGLFLDARRHFTDEGPAIESSSDHRHSCTETEQKQIMTLTLSLAAAVFAANAQATAYDVYAYSDTHPRGLDP